METPETNTQPESEDPQTFPVSPTLMKNHSPASLHVLQTEMLAGCDPDLCVNKYVHPLY